VFLFGCGGPSKQDIISKARDVETRELLEVILGKPDNIGKLGPIEEWTYNASDGKAVFIIAGNKVAIETTGKKDSKN